MKKKFIIFTLCFTLIFSSLNFKKSYADGGVISLPILATVSALAVGTGIVISNNDDLYDIGRLFYDYIDRHNDLTWATVQTVFSSSVSLMPNKLVSVDSKFLDIIKGFFDDTFLVYDELDISNISFSLGLPYLDNLNSSQIESISYKFTMPKEPIDFSIGGIDFVYNNTFSNDAYDYSAYVNDVFCGFTFFYLGQSYHCGLLNSYDGSVRFACSRFSDSIGPVFRISSLSDSFTFPYQGGYTWDNVDSKKENESVSLPIPGDLGQLVGQGSKDFWDNTDNLVGDGVISLPDVSNPSIGLDDSTSFPSVDSDVGVVDPSVPSDGIWSTIKEFIISLVVPNDTFWTDTWGGLYNNFISSFPMVDMDGFNDLVTGEKKFPNIDINIMGVTGRVVNGDVINSIVDWLRPIIAGFMMLCLMLFNYRKIYKLIRNTEPFGGIAPGTSDFRTGISEYKHDYITPTGLSMPYQDYLEHSKTQRKWEMANPGKDYGEAGFTKVD